MNRKTMTEGTPWRHILRFAMPVLAGSLLQKLYNTVDAIAVGRFAGKAALPAILRAVGDSAAHIRTVALINIILSMDIPLFGVFQGANHSGIPTIVATGVLSVRVMVTYLFRYSHLFGYTIIWWNGLFGFGMGCTIARVYYLSGRWQRNARIA